MPIYEYIPDGTGACAKCKDGFESLRKSSDAELLHCPACGNPVRRVVSAVNVPRPGPSLDPKNVERHGFTQYRKSGKGTYEKTAGIGPRTITDD